jgi:hypothetical protein
MKITVDTENFYTTCLVKLMIIVEFMFNFTVLNLCDETATSLDLNFNVRYRYFRFGSRHLDFLTSGFKMEHNQ